jgi:hypothetical protein
MDRIVWAEAAIQDLDEIAKYISFYKPIAANRGWLAKPSDFHGEFIPLTRFLANTPPMSSVVNPAEFAFNRNFGPTRPYRSSSHDHPTICPIKTSNAIRTCSLENSCARPPTGNDSKNNRAATSGISVDSGPALRKNFKNRSKCPLYQYSVLSATRIRRPSTIRTTQGFGCSTAMISFPAITPHILQPSPELSTFFSPLCLNRKFV